MSATPSQPSPAPPDPTSPLPSTPPPASAPPPASTPPPVDAPPPSTPPPSAPPPVEVPPPMVSPPAPASTSPPPAPGSTPPPEVLPPAPSPPERRPPPAHSPPGKSPPVVARSPPPPAAARTHPPPPSGSGSGAVSTTLVVGIAAGVVILVLLLLIVVCLCFRRKRKDPAPPPGPYYGGGDDYYAEQWQRYQAPPPPGNVGKIPPPGIPPPTAYASRPGMPPPPPPLFSSSGGSGSNHSGPENQTPSSPGIAFGFARSTFTYQELLLATDGFSDANLLGQGGFGYVHRGMLQNGKEVAVKQLKAGSGQGEREFQAEIEIISRVHHRHLVSLVGYCITGDRRLLVYEFIPNNTLEFHLHGKGRPTMEWATRLKIALGSAKGLAYLHEDCHPKIIHRDIKAANILLDYKFEPKVADFGLAKFTSDANTHVSTRVMGTFGYLAPEYATSGKLSDKSDVFSFGVVLLELITGRRPVEATNTLMDDSLVDWARPLLARALEDGNYDALVDPRLEKKYNINEMASMIACAAACVRHSARRRPRMTQVVRALDGDSSLDDLIEGVGQGSAYGSRGGSDYDSSQYNEDMKKIKKTAFASQEYASSGYSAATSEYGQNPSASSSEAVTREITREMDASKVKQNSGGFR